MPCTYDFEVTAAQVPRTRCDDGEVPLEFLFSGTVFYSAAGGCLQTARIGWDREAEYRLPVAVWRETMDHYFPGTRLAAADRGTRSTGSYAYKARHALPSWEHALDALLRGEAEDGA